MVKEPALTLPQSSIGSTPLFGAGYQRIDGVLSPLGLRDTQENAASQKAQSHKRKRDTGMTDVHAKPGNDPSRVADHSDDEEQDGGGKSKGKSRRELPAGAVATLKAWLLSPEHFTHPYPTPQDQVILMQKTGIDKKQLKNWFTNARRRIWKPMLKKQLEQGKLQATGAGGVVAIPGAVPGMVAAPLQSPPGASATPPQPSQEFSAPQAAAPPSQPSELHTHYQHALQQPQQQQQNYDVYGQSQMQTQQPNHPGSQPATNQQGQYGGGPYYAAQQSYGQQQQQAGAVAPAPGAPITQSNSIGSLPPIPPSGGSSTSMAAMNKTDSHAVLMELFARDQDLVRQATESARLKAQAATAAATGTSTAGGDSSQQQSQQHTSSVLGSQHPMKMAAQGTKMGSVPSLNSWPHFSSVSSLNNLGTMTGVKSITNMSGADLASQGNLNKKGNLAQVKSMESMGGRADSYAFLEVFFDNTGSAGGSQGQSGQRGVKREREEDNDVGLSLDADESPSAGNMKPTDSSSASAPAPAPGAPRPAPLPTDGKDRETLSDSGTLKRAYDDALAARGLISVSRSSEKLTDLALPAKMQRTLSQEYLRQQMQTAPNPGQGYSGYSYTASDNQNAVPSQTQSDVANTHQQTSGDSQQYPGQNPGQQHANATGNQTGQQHYSGSAEGNACSGNTSAPLSDPSMPGGTVEVPATTKCALCHRINVDTQLRPCGHMFHGRCLKPSLQNAVGPPQCPIDHITMQSAVLAVPVEDDPSTPSTQKMQQQPHGGGGQNMGQSYQQNASGQALADPVNRNS
mmetsp:Transcript_25637/g.47777  ORF Transcript_25637/g.47777 Transcript_25637/m.47777 type:complete len:797 (-) Transcript_25637:5-2395(-)